MCEHVSQKKIRESEKRLVKDVLSTEPSKIISNSLNKSIGVQRKSPFTAV